MSNLIAKFKQISVLTYYRKILENVQKENETCHDLEHAWAKLVSRTDAEKKGATINLFYHNVSLTVSEDENYARKLATICESSRIKEELGEEILWQYKDEKGFFFKKIRKQAIITNYRIIYLNSNDQELIQLPIKYADVVVVNAKTQSWRNGSAAGGWSTSAAMGMGFFKSEGIARRVGDLWFIFQGQKILELTNVLDPNGIKRTIDTVKKQIHNSKEEKTTDYGRQ